MTETETETEVEPRAEEEDNTPIELRSWGLSGQPVSWANQSWQPAVTMIRAGNLGRVTAAAVQEVLDASFPDAGYQAADVMLAHPPTGTFSATVTDNSVRVDLAGDVDLLLPDECVEWDFGDGTLVRDAGGWDHAYAAAGSYDVRLTVGVAGSMFSTTQTVDVADPVPVAGDEEVLETAYDPSEHTVDEVLAYVAEHPDEADEIREAEEAGKGRVTILDKL